MPLMNGKLVFAVLGISCLALACTKSNKPEIWVYTSSYKEVVAEYEAELAKAFPDVSVKFYQGGSEVVASKVNAELLGGKTKADLLMTADFNFYDDLKKAGKLVKWAPAAAAQIRPEFNDPDGYYYCGRVGVMVIGYNSEALKEADAPKSFQDLALPKWNGKVSMGSPLDSGTTFALTAHLVESLGWPYFETLRKQGLMASGGNSAVVTRMETKERPVGMLLLENVLKSWERGSPVRPIYPSDGALVVPQPTALTTDSQNPELAKTIYDWFFTETAMKITVKSGLYAPYDFPPPTNAAKYGTYKTVMAKHGADRDGIKKKFTETVLR